MTEPQVHTVQLPMCDLCLDGAGGECHTPGCIMWINRAPDLAIRSDPRVEFVEHQTCPRTCTHCDGNHHWVPGFDEDYEDLPILRCKHCPTQRLLGDDEDPDAPHSGVLSVSREGS